MLFFQDEKDKLRKELDTINRKLEALKALQEHQQELLDLFAKNLSKVMDSMNGYPHGTKKDGTPRAKPGRKPKGVKA